MTSKLDKPLTEDEVKQMADLVLDGCEHTGLTRKFVDPPSGNIRVEVIGHQDHQLFLRVKYHGPRKWDEIGRIPFVVYRTERAVERVNALIRAAHHYGE